MPNKKSPRTVNPLELMNESEGFFIEAVTAGTMFEIETRSGSTYTLIVSRPEQHEVVLTGPHDALKKPTLFNLQGGTAGGSMVKAGFIGNGLRMRLNGPGSLLTTSPVVEIREVNDLSRALEMLAEAELNRPPPVTDERIKKFEEFVESLILQLPPEYQDRARGYVLEFNFEGQGMIVQIFRLANEAGKLDRAFDVLNDHWSRHWAYRAPEIRGSFVTEQDEYYIRLAYEEIGLALPK